MMTFTRDLALAVRSLRKQPGYAAAVVLTLGFGLAVAGIVVAAADRALLRPLPYRDPSRLLLLWERSKVGDIRLASYPTFLDWQRSNRLFAGLGYARGTLGVLRTGDSPVQLAVAYVPGAVATLVALLVTWWGLSVLRVAAPTGLPRAVELALDWRVIGLVLGLGVVTTALATVAPAARTLSGHRTESLRAGWQPTSGGRTGGRLRSVLACMQLALALTLLAGAGLLLESFRRLRAVDLGFDTENLSAFWVSPPAPKYETPERAAELYRRLMQAVAEVPGVRSVAIANHVPLDGGWMTTSVRVPGRTPLADGSDAALYKTVSEDYLRVMRTRLVRGRWFTAEDMRDRGTAVVVNETMARQFWPNVDPVGQALTIFRSSQARPGFGDPQPSVVVGVIGDMHHLSIADDPLLYRTSPLAVGPFGGAALALAVVAVAAAWVPARRAARVDPVVTLRGE
jgi:putative ABC transport system permease protein